MRESIAQQAEIVLASNPDRRRLMTVPGVGPLTALTILAKAGDLRRFAHHRQFLKFCGMSLSTQQSGRFRGISRLSKYCNAGLRTAFWIAAKTAVRMRENSLRRKFDRYVPANPLDADLRRKACSAVAAKLARIVYGVIKNGTDYRPFFEEAIQGVSPLASCRWGGFADPVDNVWAFHLGWHSVLSTQGHGLRRWTLCSFSGKLELAIPRDRHGRFDPVLIGKYRRPFAGFDDKIIALSGAG
jgi:hypothetical protein